MRFPATVVPRTTEVAQTIGGAAPRRSPRASARRAHPEAPRGCGVATDSDATVDPPHHPLGAVSCDREDRHPLTRLPGPRISATFRGGARRPGTWATRLIRAEPMHNGWNRNSCEKRRIACLPAPAAAASALACTGAAANPRNCERRVSGGARAQQEHTRRSDATTRADATGIAATAACARQSGTHGAYASTRRSLQLKPPQRYRPRCRPASDREGGQHVGKDPDPGHRGLRPPSLVAGRRASDRPRGRSPPDRAGIGYTAPSRSSRCWVISYLDEDGAGGRRTALVPPVPLQGPGRSRSGRAGRRCRSRIGSGPGNRGGRRSGAAVLTFRPAAFACAARSPEPAGRRPAFTLVRPHPARARLARHVLAAHDRRRTDSRSRMLLRLWVRGVEPRDGCGRACWRSTWAGAPRR